jgi:hypothetical protein
MQQRQLANTPGEGIQKATRENGLRDLQITNEFLRDVSCSSIILEGPCLVRLTLF